MVVVKALPAALLLVACHARNPDFCPNGADGNGECLAPDARRVCAGAAPFEICVAAPDKPRKISRVDTTAGCDEIVTLGHELCVVSGTDIEIGQRVPVRGSRPAVIFASGSLTIDENGVVDAAGTSAAGGPGADLACGGGATLGGNNVNGGGGGAGGSFGTRGANGGNGGGASGGVAAATIANPLVLQGGCSGTDGGEGSGTGSDGERGFGGGGIYLVAGQKLTIQGIVNASGGGGHGGRPSQGGGGGGGSGGMIVLYAPDVVVASSTQIFANGGAGGAGASSSSAGGDGSAPTTALSVARGGQGQGDGGDGAYMTTAPRIGQASSDGGGGGGGGLGVIYILGGDFSGATLSPPPT